MRILASVLACVAAFGQKPPHKPTADLLPLSQLMREAGLDALELMGKASHQAIEERRSGSPEATESGLEFQRLHDRLEIRISSAGDAAFVEMLKFAFSELPYYLIQIGREAGDSDCQRFPYHPRLATLHGTCVVQIRASIRSGQLRQGDCSIEHFAELLAEEKKSADQFRAKP